MIAAYSQVDTGEWGESGTPDAVVEFANNMQVAWEYPITKDAKISLFYYHFGTREDELLREDIETATNNMAYVSQAESLGYISSAEADLLNEIPAILEINKTTSTTSIGISIQTSFGD
ncbi:hypothetical protein KJ966_01325 [bacterium]|nr:hypothetical protein [bacterium]